MKKVILTAVILFSVSAVFTSCRDAETEKETTTIVKEVEVETKKEVEESEGILERAAKKADKEVNDEIDDQIDRIGDDN
jgi:hypothetical protein